MDKLYKEVSNTISEMDNDDETLALLEKAVDFFCGEYDRCEGLKHALLLTIDDQFDNHKEEQEEKDWKQLYDILNKAI